jgi:chromosome partitioning protein
LGIPIVAELRDSQNYVRASELGLGLHEMKPYQVAEDLAQWQPLLDWLERPSRQGKPAAAPLAGSAPAAVVPGIAVPSVQLA